MILEWAKSIAGYFKIDPEIRITRFVNRITSDPKFVLHPKHDTFTYDGQGPFCYRCFTKTGKQMHVRVARPECRGEDPWCRGPHGNLAAPYQQNRKDY